MGNPERIELLRAELIKLGYHGFQINEIYCEALGDYNYKSLNSDQYQVLSSVMAYYVEFAKRCLAYHGGRINEPCRIHVITQQMDIRHSNQLAICNKRLNYTSHSPQSP